MSSSGRNLYFDNAKFVLIFLVVFGHLISPYKNNDGVLFTLYTVIFLFHMPAFILISGYFSKGFQKKGYIIKAIKKILVPYLIFQFIYSIYYYYTGVETKFTINFFEPHWSLWFLLSLFFWNILLFIFARFRWIGLIVASLIGIAIGYWDNAGSYLSLSRTFVFFPYFLLGFLLEPKHLKKLRSIKYTKTIGLAILMITVLLSVSFPKDAIPWLLGDTSYAGMGVKDFHDGFLRAGQYVATTIIIIGFLFLIPEKGFKLTVIGQRTLYVYLLHGFIIKSIDTFAPDSIHDWISSNYLLLLIISLSICLILGSYFTKKYTRPIIELRL
ncbi:acyltransferase family protein [Heyndrickxia ginsengihumi]|uniref:Acyltransferase family protein n=1 Tax=Heyndrickxia ginsengihumi TaxID=363870 RepID=A0A6M0P415_9BACI|nr:acyltransferase family protein [Heyndrickxia ginsengihumi]MBE6184743.1 acyltransferase [Bacillus sp. (in: firmicutes)]MCM3022971.1 acyltransferase family protein [Heyndrickxia ginsengihumi]NEY19442.1 acyltransferase family protein [Heyndrickxia ginsengihumi]